MYLELAEGTVKNRKILCEESELQGYIELARKHKRELYRSYYWYDKDIIPHVKLRNTFSGHTGNFFLKLIVFDIDKGMDKDSFVLERARRFVNVLNEDWHIPRSSIDYWFSGRGYHIVIPNVFKFIGSNHLPADLKKTVEEHFPEIADTAPFMATGLIRIGYTINNKSQLYKIRLTEDEFAQLSCEGIFQLAEKGEVRNLPKVEWDYSIDYSEKIKEAPKSEKEIKVKTVKETFGPNVTCMQKLHARGPVEGRRHKDMMRMISSYRRKEVPFEGIMSMMKAWASTMDEKEVEKYVNDIFKYDLKYGCFDEVMKEFCDPKCIFYKHKDFQSEFVTAKDMEKQFVNFVRSDFTNRVIDIGELFHLSKPFKIYPGEYVLLIGDTKLGKSALVQNMAVYLPKMKIDYYSTEMNARMIYRRSVQIYYDKTKDEIWKYYQANNNTLSDVVQHIEVLPGQPDVVALEKMIVERNPDLVIIDTIKSLRTGKLEEFGSKEEKLSTVLSNIAQKHDKIILGVHHIPKGKSGKSLTIHSGLGSGSLEQLADKVLGFEGIEKQKDRLFSSLGSRDEDPFAVKLLMNKQTFKMTKLMELPIK